MSLLVIAGAILAFAGLAGLLLPLLPGAPLLFLGLLLAAWGENFNYIGVWTLSLLFLMASATYLVEFAASFVGIKKYGGSRRAVYGAAIGGCIGLFLGVPGVLLGPFAGAFIGEITQSASLEAAGRASLGTVFGVALGIAGKFAIGVAMIGMYLVIRFL